MKSTHSSDVIICSHCVCFLNSDYRFSNILDLRSLNRIFVVKQIFTAQTMRVFNILILIALAFDKLKVLFTARKRSLGQGNMFTPVCHSVHGGGGWSRGGLSGLGGAWSCGGGAWFQGDAWFRGCLVLGGYLVGGCLVLGGVPGPGGLVPEGCRVKTPPMATAADGTHPTGMHSWLDFWLM